MLKYKQYKNMKTKIKRQESTELPRFAVGALAIAGASTANAATVQITFKGSFISSTGGYHIVTDFGGDGVADVVSSNRSNWRNGYKKVGVRLNGALSPFGYAMGGVE
ncbi:MAG: hypothetical protein ORN51_12540 [Akkermansiaceae bacterium]|nr:hypothetical protein [Akkermansiaceae bacterium]